MATGDQDAATVAQEEALSMHQRHDANPITRGKSHHSHYTTEHIHSSDGCGLQGAHERAGEEPEGVVATSTVLGRERESLTGDSGRNKSISEPSIHFHRSFASSLTPTCDYRPAMSALPVEVWLTVLSARRTGERRPTGRRRVRSVCLSSVQPPPHDQTEIRQTRQAACNHHQHRTKDEKETETRNTTRESDELLSSISRAACALTAACWVSCLPVGVIGAGSRDRRGGSCGVPFVRPPYRVTLLTHVWPSALHDSGAILFCCRPPPRRSPLPAAEPLRGPFRAHHE